MPDLVRPPTLASAVIDWIKEGVLRGEFSPGTALPEVQLAKTLKISRGTVREALRALQDLGLVEVVPHTGAFVTRLTLQRAEEIFSLRALIEGFAARRAAETGRLDESAVARIDAAFADLKMAAAQDQVFEVIHADMRLHWEIATTSGHGLLMEHLDSIQLQTRLAILYTKLYDTDPMGEAESHEPIVVAVRDRDPERLVGSLQKHISDSGHRLMRRLRDIQADP